MMHRHIADPPAPPSTRTELDIHPAFDAVVMACLAKDPGQRPASAQALAQRLAAIPFSTPWTAERALGWWETHVPAAGEPQPCDQGELAPAVSGG
jgi:hypothetical protein